VPGSAGGWFYCGGEREGEATGEKGGERERDKLGEEKPNKGREEEMAGWLCGLLEKRGLGEGNSWHPEAPHRRRRRRPMTPPPPPRAVPPPSLFSPGPQAEGSLDLGVGAEGARARPLFACGAWRRIEVWGRRRWWVPAWWLGSVACGRAVDATLTFRYHFKKKNGGFPRYYCL